MKKRASKSPLTSAVIVSLLFLVGCKSKISSKTKVGLEAPTTTPAQEDPKDPVITPTGGDQPPSDIVTDDVDPVLLFSFDLTSKAMQRNDGTTDLAQDGSVTLSKTRIYNQSTMPGMVGNYITRTASDAANGLLYIGDLYNGVSIINTQKTPSFDDDVVVGTYTTATTPSLGTQNGTSRLTFDQTSGFLYLNVYNSGLVVIDTNNNADPSDDTLVFRYTSTTTPALGSDRGYCGYLSPSNLLYFCSTDGLTIINTQGTITAADDVQVANLTTLTTPAVADRRINSIAEDTARNVLFVGTQSGLTVIDHKGTATIADDIVLGTYNASSTPALNSDWAFDVKFQPETGFLFVGNYWTNGGFVVIDTKKTATLADDTLVHSYSSEITKNGNSSVSGVLINEEKYYLATFEGVFEIDTHNTATGTDDTVTNWNERNRLPSNNIRSISKGAFGEVYAGTPYGLASVNPTFNNAGEFHSTPTPIDSKFSNISWEADVGDDHSVKVYTRTGSPSYIEDSLDDDVSNITDQDSWGSPFPTISESGSTITFTGLPSDPEWATNNFDTGKPANYYPVGSLVRLSYRFLSEATKKTICVFEDDYGVGNYCEEVKDDEWHEINYYPTTPFSYFGIYPYWELGTWSASDKLEIRDLEIFEAASWSDWSAPYQSSASNKLIMNPGHRLIQTKVEMTTSNPASSPKLRRLSFE